MFCLSSCLYCSVFFYMNFILNFEYLQEIYKCYLNLTSYLKTTKRKNRRHNTSAENYHKHQEFKILQNQKIWSELITFVNFLKIPQIGVKYLLKNTEEFKQDRRQRVSLNIIFCIITKNKIKVIFSLVSNHNFILIILMVYVGGENGRISCRL